MGYTQNASKTANQSEVEEIVKTSYNAVAIEYGISTDTISEFYSQNATGKGKDMLISEIAKNSSGKITNVQYSYDEEVGTIQVICTYKKKSYTVEIYVGKDDENSGSGNTGNVTGGNTGGTGNTSGGNTSGGGSGGTTEVAPAGISLNVSSAILKVGETKNITATITPSTATNKTITWTSENSQIVNVSGSGMAATINAISAGSTKITASTSNGKTASCNVVVLQTGEIVQVGSTTWDSTNHTASITIKTTSQGYTFEYQKNSNTGTWTTISGSEQTITGLSHGDTIYAIIKYGTQVEQTASFDIQDLTAPNEATINLSANTVKTGETLTVNVTHTDNQSGININSCKYIFDKNSSKLGKDSESWNTAQAFTQNPQIITLDTNTAGTYYLHVLTKDMAGNKQEAISQEIKIAIILKAVDVINYENKAEIYGKTVTNYECSNKTINESLKSENITWKIIYAKTDEQTNTSNIYLITSDYISIANIPYSTKNGIQTSNKPSNTDSSYKKAVPLSNVYSDYTAGSSSITNTAIKNLNKNYYDYLSKVSKTSTYSNIKGVAYMLDENAWQGFSNTSYTDYAIGGPTIEMLMNSYSQKYGVNYKTNVTSEYGYRISTDGGNSWKYNMSTDSEFLNSSDSLYVIKSATNAYGMWLASPSGNDVSYVMCSDSYGYVGRDTVNGNNLGFRPVVCLTSNVKLLKETDGNFTIMHNN